MGLTGTDLLKSLQKQRTDPNAGNVGNYDIDVPDGWTQVGNQASAPTVPVDEQPVTYSSSLGSSGYDAALQAQMDEIFRSATGGRRAPRQDEYDQWIGPRGYLMSDNFGGGHPISAWTTGGTIDPYWAYRMTTHAQGDYYGDNPAALGGGGGAVDVPTFQPAAPITAPSTSYHPGAISVGQGGAQGGYSASGSNGLLMTPEINDQARARILELLNTPSTVDPTKLRDSPEMQGVYLMAQRAEERDRAALAERAAAGGWSGSGGFEGGLNALRQQRGESEMQMMGQLASTYMDRQREDLQRGIEFALNQGQFEAAQTLQRDLATLDAQIEQERIAAQVGMSNADLALRAQLGEGDLSLRRDSLGFDYAQLQYQANRDAMLAALRAG